MPDGLSRLGRQALNVLEKGKEIALAPGETAFEAARRTSVQDVLRGVEIYASPLYLPQRLRFTRWLLFGGKRPFGPEDPSEIDLSKITTDAQAIAAIDSLIGLDPTDIRRGRVVQQLREGGQLERMVQALSGQGELSTPFSASGQARLATGDFESLRDPYVILDGRLQQTLAENPGVATAYLRETDPMSLLPALVEQDSGRVGQEKSNVLKDIQGRLLGGAKAVFVNPWTSAERLEEALGYAWYNDVPDSSLRLEASKRFYDLQFNGLTNDTAPRQMKEKIDQLIAEGKTGSVAAEELDQWFQDNPLGWGSMVADLAGKIVLDPLWLIPLGAIGKGVSIPVRAATKAERVSLLVRRLTPAGGKIAQEQGGGLQGVRALVQMSEASYAEAKWALPNKGPTSWLWTRTPGHLTDGAKRTVGIQVFPVSRSLTKTDDLGQLMRDVNETFKTGTLQGELATRTPRLLDDPVTAEFMATVKGQKRVLFNDEEIKALQDGAGTIYEGVPLAERIDLFQQGLMHQIGITGLKQQDQIWRQTASGRFMQDRYMPLSGWMRGVLGTVSLNTPGFAHLNVVSNTFRMAWATVQHPVTMGKVLAHGTWMEAGTILKGGGRYPDVFTDMLRPHGLTPLNVEQMVANQSGAREIGDIGRRTLEDAIKFAGDDTVVAAQETMDLMRRAAYQPAKHVGEKRRLHDMIAPFVYATSRIDNFFRRSTFLASLKQQSHIALADIEGRFLPPIKNRLVGQGVDPAVASRVAGQVKDDFYGLFSGRLKPSDIISGKEFVDDDVINAVIERRAAKLLEGTAEGSLSGSHYIERYMSTRGFSGEALSASTYDLRGTSEFINTEILPKLGKEGFGPDEAAHALDAWVQQHFDVSDITRQIGRMESTARPRTTYSSHLRLTDEAIKGEMQDTLGVMERFLRAQHFGDRGWQDLPHVGMSKARRFHEAAQKATVGSLEHLAAIRRVYDDFALRGETKLAGDTPIPDELLQTLPENLRAENVAGLWDNYFQLRDDAWNGFFDESKALVEGNKPAQEAVERVRESLTETFSFHRAKILEGRAAGTDEAWGRIADSVAQRFRRNQQKRPALLNLPPNDPIRALDAQDAQGPLAQQLHEFVEWVKPQLTEDFARLEKGELRLGSSHAQTVKEMMGEARGAYSEASQTMVANARATTDFAMLNYNNQYGIDQVVKMFVPFAFWPSREAVHWGIRAARAPGAVGALVLAMTEPDKFAAQYNYPTRLKTRIPVYMPFLDDMMRNVPVVGDRLASGDFSPFYWTDPIQMLFPYRQIVNDRFDDPERRNTVSGRILDYAENYTPFSFNPFMKMIGAETGLLDKDAWRSFGFQGGPFGIPVTPAAREVGKWLYEGDETAIPSEEQEFYMQRGRFSKGVLGRVLGLEPGKFDVYRAERALWTLATTEKLLPGQSKEEQVQAAWLALDTHAGPAWKNAVKAAESEDFLRQLTGYIGFPAGAATAVNEGELMWLSLRAAYGEAARRNELDTFFAKYPEFEIRSAVVKGISDPQEKRAAVDTELYYEALDRVVERPFAIQERELTDERDKLQQMDQLPAVRDQLEIIDTQLDEIRQERSKLREQVEAAFPNRETELSLFRDPHSRALREARSGWFDVEWQEGEPFEAFTARREEFLAQFGGTEDPVGEQRLWDDLGQESLLTKIEFGQKIEKALEQERYNDLDGIFAARDGKLEAIHERGEAQLSRRDVERYLASFTKPKTPEQQEFERADSIFQYWMGLMGGAFTGREKAAMSAFFRELPEIQKFFPIEATDLEDLSFQQRLAIDTRREFWSTYHAIGDSDTQLDYFYMVKPEIDEANRLLGLPPITPIDVSRTPPEYLSDPLIAHVELMATLRRKGLLEEEEGLSPEEQEELDQLLVSYGGDDEQFGALTRSDLDSIIGAATVE